MIRNVLLVALGGGIGSVARYLCQRWFGENMFASFPWATFIVNLSGCFLIGVIYAATERSQPGNTVRLLLATGFCGGFTTFSAFAFENMNMIRNNDIMALLLYSAASVVLGIIGVFAGIALVGFIK